MKQSGFLLMSMDWTAPFIVYRISEEGKLEEVFHAPNLKKAKYWLTYIAEPGDVLCRTPAHPRHSAEKPEYWSHKGTSGSPATDAKNWESYAKSANWGEEWPEEQGNEVEV